MPPTTVFERVRREPWLSEKVAQAVTEHILSERLPSQHKLPSERDLAEQFGVSRTVIREAMQALIARGVVESLSGRGLVVAARSGDAVRESMSLVVRSLGSLGYGKVHDVRAALEPVIAGLAAERTSQEDIDQLEALCTELGADPEPARAAWIDVEFHRAMARATQNELFLVMLDSISDVLLEVRTRAFSSGDMIAYAHGAHREILDRVVARDAAGARAAMEAHIAESERRLRPPK